MQEPADKKAHAISGSTGGLEDWLRLRHLWALSENTTQSAWLRTVGSLPPPNSPTVDTEGGGQRGLFGEERKAASKNSTDPHRLRDVSQEKDGNNSWRNCALHNKARLRLLSDKAGSTLEKYEGLTDKQGRG